MLDRFAIDFSLCMYCGICIEVCPFDALFWSPEFSYAEFDIRDLLHEKDRLGAVDGHRPAARPPSTPAVRRAGRGRRGRAGPPRARRGARRRGDVAPGRPGCASESHPGPSPTADPTRSHARTAEHDVAVVPATAPRRRQAAEQAAAQGRLDAGAADGVPPSRRAASDQPRHRLRRGRDGRGCQRPARRHHPPTSCTRPCGSVVCLGAVAGPAYLVLGAELVALVVPLVYVGAVVVLVLFALMLTRAPIGPNDEVTTGVART